MKKLALALSLSMAIFISCSNDDSKVETAQGASKAVSNLITKWTETHSDGESYVATYSYNDNKLDKVTHDIDGSFYKYTYTGDLITKIELFEKDNTSTAVTVLEYDNSNKLVKEVTTENRNGEILTFKSVYTHNSTDNTITEQYEDTSNQSSSVNALEKIYYIDNNEISKTVYPFNNYTTEFAYNTNNNPFKNIVGFDKIYFSFYFGEKGNQKNIDSKTSHDTTETNTYQEYNAQGYPTKLNHTYVKTDSKNISTDIEIEYSL